jgi:Protein of unknown function (DUF2778)
MTTFSIKAGQIVCATAAGPAYSGAPGHVDDPTAEAIKACGPIPEGTWAIGAMIADGGKLGPNVLPLEPVAGTVTFGRGGFFIHGDNAAHDETASEGCIIAGQMLREAIDQDPDRTLQVVA